ncbi:MAG TPA: hypothetical protein VEY67_06370 [Candidatus Dormibacteraeota bacterium]|nr:hypothetical protein [Candidatus Dormibacteraeota bacterium]
MADEPTSRDPAKHAGLVLGIAMAILLLALMSLSLLLSGPRPV